MNQRVTVVAAVLTALAVALAPSVAGTGFVDFAILLDLFLMVTVAAVSAVGAHWAVRFVVAAAALLRRPVGVPPIVRHTTGRLEGSAQSPLIRGSIWARAPAPTAAIA